MTIPSTAPVIDPPDAIIVSTQRSGTHFLQSLLGNHPGVQTRGEFILHYQRQRDAGIRNPELVADEKVPYRYRKRPECLNIGIVMYSHLDLLEQLCGPIASCQVIHLIRNPIDVARSTFQMEVDRKILGDRFQAHYHENDKKLLPPLTTSPHEAKYAAEIAALQQAYRNRLNSHPDLLEITYEELCGNAQVNVLADRVAEKLLGFLKLEMRPLTTRLVKSGQRGTDANELAVCAHLDS